MAVYEYTDDGVNPTCFLTESHIYGGKRLGIYNRNVDMEASYTPPATEQRILGNRNYEMSNHLNNVLNVISDRLLTVDGNSDTYVDYYSADVTSWCDYTPFGMVMPGRNGNSSEYDYGFNGMLKDDEIKGEGNSYSTEFRQYDPRIGRWLSTDPVTHHQSSPYSAFDNNPVYWSDPTGADSDDWYEDKITGEFKWFEGSGEQEGYNHLGAYLITTTPDGSYAQITYQQEWSTNAKITNGTIDVLVLPWADTDLSNTQSQNANCQDVAAIKVDGISDLKGFSDELVRNSIYLGNFVVSDHGDFKDYYGFYIGDNYFTKGGKTMASAHNAYKFSDLEFLNRNMQPGNNSYFIICQCAAVNYEHLGKYKRTFESFSRNIGANILSPMYYLPEDALFNPVWSGRTWQLSKYSSEYAEAHGRGGPNDPFLNMNAVWLLSVGHKSIIYSYLGIGGGQKPFIFE